MASADSLGAAVYGAAFLFPCVLLLNVGFIAAQLVIQAQSAQGVVAGLTIPEWVLILAIPAVVIGIFGYRWIHRVMQVTIVITGLSIIVMFIQALRYGSLPAKDTVMTARRPACSSRVPPCWSSTC